MVHFIKSTTRLGQFMLRNRKKIFVGLGTIALAGAVSGVLNYLKTRRSISDALREPSPKKIPLAERAHGHKHDMYKAPAISPENLARH